MKASRLFHRVFLTLLLTYSGLLYGQELSLKSLAPYPPSELILADTLYDQKKYQEANNELDRLIQEIDTVENMRLYIAILEMKAKTYRRLDGVGFEDAFPIIIKASELAKENLQQEDILLARVYRTLGLFHHRLRDFFNARNIMDTSMALYLKASTRDPKLYGSIVDYKYYAYSYSNGSIDTLINYLDLRKNYGLAEANPKAVDILYILQDYPDLYIARGDYEKALTFAIQGYKYAIENKMNLLEEGMEGFEVYANSYVNLIDVLFSRKDYQKALEISTNLLGEIEDLNISKESYEEYYAVIRTIGQIYYNLGEYENALSFFRNAQNIGTASMTKAVYYGLVQISIGDCLHRLGSNEEAARYYKKGIEVLKGRIDMPSTQFHQPFNDFGDYYFENEMFNMALMKYDSALMNSLPRNEKTWFEFPQDSAQDLSLSQINTIASKTSLFDKLNVDSIPNEELYMYGLKYASQLHKSLIDKRTEFSATEGKLFLTEEFRFVYENALEYAYQLYSVNPSEEYFLEGLKFMRLSKSILFLEQSAEYEKVNNNIVDQELKQDFSEYKKRLDVIEKGFYSLIDDGVTSDSIFALNDTLSIVRNQLDSVLSVIDDELRMANWPELTSVLDQNLYNIQDENNEVQIEYFYGEKHLYAVGSANGKRAFIKVPIDSELEFSILEIINILSAPPRIQSFDDDKENFAQHSHFLYSKLISPILEEIGEVDRIVIIPDQILSRLPFEVLIDSYQKGQGYNEMNFLISEYDLTYQLSSLSNYNADQKTANGEILGLGYASSANNDLDDLPGTEREINFLKASYKGTFINSASKEQFLNLSSQYDILHLAVHGRSDTISKYESSLIFSTGSDRELKTSDLYLAGLNARLAVLSACESGIGSLNKGEGVFSIARGFALTGVPSVVMTLWNVPDKIASGLMQDMYVEFIDNGLTINRALEKAKRDYLAQSDSYFAHPYYWASFIHLGDDLSFKESSNINYLYLLIILPIVLLAFYVRYKKRKRTI